MTDAAVAVVQFGAFEDRDHVVLILEYAAKVRPLLHASDAALHLCTVLQRQLTAFACGSSCPGRVCCTAACSALAYLSSVCTASCDTSKLGTAPAEGGNFGTRGVQGDLFDMLRNVGGRMKEREVVHRIMWPFMSGISYIHSLGIIHRDIKLENTLFSADGTLKIADFGLSVDLSVEAAVTRLGTLDYMSPGAGCQRLSVHACRTTQRRSVMNVLRCLHRARAG
jgi:Protein kinase domain